MFVLMLLALLVIAAGTWRQSALVFGRVPGRRTRLGLLGAGYALLSMSLLLTLAGDDPSRAIVSWFGQLTAASLIAMLACSLLQSRRARRRD